MNPLDYVDVVELAALAEYLAPSMSRADLQPILEAIPAARQEDARHYGVHPYFTRRPANVVRAYLERYSQAGDVVLDPFGGTGVTAIEAFLLGRHAIQNDLNPFANFIAQNIADTTLPSLAPLHQAFIRVQQACTEPLAEIEKDDAAAQRWLTRLPLPENIRLPRNSDAEFFHEMFTPRQMAGLSLIKQAIVGGECGLTEEHYKASLARSISTCFRLLRPDRWFSIVFQHWDLSYFGTILETAGECGAELKAAITQTGDVIWSMHKKKNSASVLAGEMILTFYKPGRIHKAREPLKSAEQDAAAILSEVFDVCLGNGTNSFTSEALFNRLVMELWRRRALGCLSLDRREFASRLEQRGWTYNPRTQLWSKGGFPKSSLGELMLFDA